MPETITKLTTFKSKLIGICKTENTNTSKRNTESIHNSNLNMAMVVTTAEDMEVIPMAVTENLTMEEAMEVTQKEVTEVDMVAATDTVVAMDTEVNRTMVEVQDTEAVFTGVTINPGMEEVRGMEAMTDRKMPNTIKMDTNIQMKIKNEFGPKNYFSFYN